MYSHTASAFSPANSIALDVQQVLSQNTCHKSRAGFLGIFRFSVKNDCVNAKWTRTKCIIFFFGPDLKNQENWTTSVNTLLMVCQKNVRKDMLKLKCTEQLKNHVQMKCKRKEPRYFGLDTLLGCLSFVDIHAGLRPE